MVLLKKKKIQKHFGFINKSEIKTPNNTKQMKMKIFLNKHALLRVAKETFRSQIYMYIQNTNGVHGNRTK